jgi:hypothetical protein
MLPLGTVQLPYQSVFPEYFKFLACIFHETVISKHSSVAKMYVSGTTENYSLFLETEIIDGHCQIPH